MIRMIGVFMFVINECFFCDFKQDQSASSGDNEKAAAAIKKNSIQQKAVACFLNYQQAQGVTLSAKSLLINFKK